ncbi:DUF3040 domain-containing protein [Egibacter rhizosphaerae]|uniref:DUF3040 domain-containing protein n=1 Tax=Egibacter rhizosphaerae TaxID=1670831 RepID=A0A411YAC1_9ACTN|nr:DUF3040 domain-containing protein [Egibacter rhizosphaerae]QBI18145.1 DUF3040 domain-containing protein [Egibacter rhizosphaerae]
MPLSDREQQILSDIEQRLRADDPKFAKTVGETTVSTQVRRQIKLALAGLIVGFILLLFFIASLWFGVAGFALMLGSAVYGGHQLKRLGADQTNRLGGQLRGGFDRYMRDKRERGEG